MKGHKQTNEMVLQTKPTMSESLYYYTNAEYAYNGLELELVKAAILAAREVSKRNESFGIKPTDLGNVKFTIDRLLHFMGEQKTKFLTHQILNAIQNSDIFVVQRTHDWECLGLATDVVFSKIDDKL